MFWTELSYIWSKINLQYQWYLTSIDEDMVSFRETSHPHCKQLSSTASLPPPCLWPWTSLQISRKEAFDPSAKPHITWKLGPVPDYFATRHYWTPHPPTHKHKDIKKKQLRLWKRDVLQKKKSTKLETAIDLFEIAGIINTSTFDYLSQMQRKYVGTQVILN